MTNEPFSGQFAVGLVRGSRAFCMDALGRLTGVTYKQIWKPGENLAVCKTGGPRNKFITRNFYSTMFNPFVMFDEDLDARKASEKVFKKFQEDDEQGEETPTFISQAIRKHRHDEAERKARDSLEECDHGFYGFFDNSNDYGEKRDRINGVVEGYGETVVGTRGFRSMKARIVALQIPKKLNRREQAVSLIRQNYPDIPLFDKFDTMISEYPGESGLDTGFGPEFEEDFWTREV